MALAAACCLPPPVAMRLLSAYSLRFNNTIIDEAFQSDVRRAARVLREWRLTVRGFFFFVECQLLC